MPVLVPSRRRNLVAAILVAVTLLLAASWFGWGKEGAKPVAPASTGADDINQLYAFIGFFAVAIFLSVMIPLALIIARYRERGLPREAEGPQVRGNTRLELLWTAIPLAIVVILASFTLYKARGIIDPAEAASDEAQVQIQVEGRQFYWRYVYPNGAIAIDRLRVPLQRVVELEITAPETDVAHSFWAPALGGKMDAIPGITNHLKLRATRTGVFEGRCAELCGIQHSVMKLEVEVLPVAEYERWVRETSTEQQQGTSLGQTLFESVCSKCHFAAPEYAPNIAASPLLGNADTVKDIVTNGRRRMPAVGRGWTDRELDSLTAYLKTIAPKESSSGG
jgi:cytochrome c oxidase subunit 2